MNLHSADELRRLIAARLDSSPSQLERHLPALSRAFHEMQQAGIDVELEILGVCAEMGFKMKTEGLTSWSMETSAVLSIGASRHLVAFMTERTPQGSQVSQPCMVMLVSKLDMRYQGTHDTLRTLAYDLGDDKNSLAAFQEFVAGVHAKQQRYARADKANAFSKAAANLTRKSLVISGETTKPVAQLKLSK